MTNNATSFSLRQLVIERAQGRCEYCLILKNAEIIGITDIGQATSRLLMFNTSSRMRSRKSLIDQNLYP
ncbi:hypothetical protein AA650_23535 [Anabaena sp. WA102]|uniref:hypothetical protein n=1 Tax=Anabaena sp. WA102 TaxID=1647413 RepID=UPI0006AC83D7|nr:hypothetical protein [Anabaena sp. WA102]ALB43032.1 hypothetical protein AA650_23535 [Anabaena sp. WA102]